MMVEWISFHPPLASVHMVTCVNTQYNTIHTHEKRKEEQHPKICCVETLKEANSSKSVVWLVNQVMGTTTRWGWGRWKVVLVQSKSFD